MAEGRDDDRCREEVGRDENGCGGGVVGRCDRWDQRQADGDGGDDDESSALAKQSGQDHAQGSTDQGPQPEGEDRNSCAVDLETDIGSAGDGRHDGGADGSDCARDRTASNEAASARLVGLHDRFVVGGVWGGCHRVIAACRVEVRGEVVEDLAPPATISAKNSFSQSAPLP